MKSEKDLAIELGIDRKILKGMRDAGLSGWDKVANTIMYDEDAEGSIRASLESEIGTEISPPLDPVEPVEMVITAIPRGNRRLVICGDIYVRVRNNENFINGMSLRARPPADNGRCWVMLGRCPRWRGRY